MSQNKEITLAPDPHHRKAKTPVKKHKHSSQLEVIAQAGHNVHQERPDLVNPILIRFLSAY
jgi:pimeloyl-ACP methyl ester carboxylesterase